MSYYTMRNALLALLAGGMPIGGMAAQMQNPRAPENDAKALRDIWFDKLRERLTGLIRINGTLHDTYRQSWVATVAPDYVEAGREPLVTGVDGLQAVVDKLRPDERARLEGLGLLTDGRITPAGTDRGRSDGRQALFGDGAPASARPAAGTDHRRRPALRDVHGHRVHVPAAPGQQRRRHLRSAHRPAVHERPRDLRDLLALPLSRRRSTAWSSPPTARRRRRGSGSRRSCSCGCSTSAARR